MNTKTLSFKHSLTHISIVLEKYLMSRGIIAPANKFEQGKELETYNLVNQGSYLNDGVPSNPKDENTINFNSEVVDELDDELHTLNEVLERVNFDTT